MKQNLPLAFSLFARLKSLHVVGCLMLLWGAACTPALAQVLDPSFHIAEIYGEANIDDAAQMPDGKYVVAGGFNRANGQPSKGLARFDAAGVEDQTFRQNLSGATVSPRAFSAIKLVPMGNGQLLVLGDYTLGAVQRRNLFRLNADGTLDPTLDLLLSVPGYQPELRQAIVQPDGRILLSGYNLMPISYNMPQVFRVLSDGSPDSSFSPPPPTMSSPILMLLQPDGKVFLANVGASPGGGNPLVRLNSNGSLDVNFQSLVRFIPGHESINGIALDANGKLLVQGDFSVSGPQWLCRLLSNGTFDPSFFAPASLRGRYCRQVEVLPNGHILLLDAPFTSTGTSYPLSSQLVQLEANGAIDAAFQPGSGPDGELFGIRPLANGNFLTWGRQYNFAGQRRTVALVQGGGGLDAAFAPLLQQPGAVKEVVREADGKLLVSGFFNAIDGHLTDRIARLLPNGQPDPAFSRRLPTSANGYDTALAAQADGKVLVGSQAFSVDRTTATTTLARLMQSGTVDTTFTPVLSRLDAYGVSLLAPLANGQVLVGGSFVDAAGKANLTRLNADGSVEPTFAPSATQPFIYAGFVQANGSIVCVVPSMPYHDRNLIQRLLPTGAPDPSFTYVSIAGGGQSSPYGPAVIAPLPATGGYVSGGVFTNTQVMAVTTATGSDVTSFASPFRPIYYSASQYYRSGINALAVQSDGRILVGGYMQQNSQGASPVNLLARLEPNGQLDTTFDANFLSTSSSNPGQQAVSGSVNALLVQPDGALLVGGYVFRAGSQAVTGLVRVLATGVLSARAVTAAHTEVWPVPAQARLSLKLEAAARPRQVTLFDALGKAVLTQVVTQTELTLDVAALARGLYVLRVDYAGGPVTQRVVLE